MSADNYYTVKAHPNTGRFHVLHGFMSNLEEDFPTLIGEGDAEFENYDDAAKEAYRLAQDWTCEYGFVSEPDPLGSIATADQLREFYEDKIRLYTSHLNWLNGEQDD